ncbi:hypothetical protein BGX38DRAFT_1264784 [Terfezia claveryi]|nr:hypothetical protein BGX38DRAFT_1264784 [Terfezia claveryi]
MHAQYPQSTLRRIDVLEYVGCIALIEGDEKHPLLGAKQGVAKIDVETGELEYLNKMYDGEQRERMRLNDGGVDVEGRPRAPTPTRPSPPVGVSNGIGWSPDNSTAYFTDTKRGTIFIYQFDTSTGRISSQETFINFSQTPENDAYRWQAKEPKGKMEIPTSEQVACPWFVPGGLLITTVKLVYLDPECGHSPYAGDVFFLKSEDIGGT